MQKITFSSESLTLVGNLFHNPQSKIAVLLLHGAGNSSKERFIDLQQFLYDNNISSLAIDFRGVGESQGEFKNGGLSNRLLDAISAYDNLIQLVPNTKIAVLGTSMGGHIASRFTLKRNCYALILKYPAAYSRESENLALNEEFTKAISIPNSWENSLSFKALGKFKGKILLLDGGADKVIPEEIKNKYRELAKRNGKVVTFPNGLHGLEKKDASLKEPVFNNILEFIKSL